MHTHGTHYRMINIEAFILFYVYIYIDHSFHVTLRFQLAVLSEGPIERRSDNGMVSVPHTTPQPHLPDRRPGGGWQRQPPGTTSAASRRRRRTPLPRTCGAGWWPWSWRLRGRSHSQGPVKRRKGFALLNLFQTIGPLPPRYIYLSITICICQLNSCQEDGSNDSDESVSSVSNKPQHSELPPTLLGSNIGLLGVTMHNTSDAWMGRNWPSQIKERQNMFSGHCWQIESHHNSLVKKASYLRTGSSVESHRGYPRCLVPQSPPGCWPQRRLRSWTRSPDQRLRPNTWRNCKLAWITIATK